jgi:hypothetical protein
VVDKDEEVRQEVLERLEDEDSDVLQKALRALSRAVDRFTEVFEAVLEKLGDESESYDVRRTALSALSSTVGTDAKVRQMILEVLENENSDMRAAAVRALENLFGKSPEVSRSITDRLSDQSFLVRRAAVEVIAGASEFVDSELLSQLQPWLAIDSEYSYNDNKAQGRLAALFGSQILRDPCLRDRLFALLQDPRLSARLGAALTLLHWPESPPDDVLERIFKALEDRRGLDAYPAQLTAASFLVNQDEYAKAAIDLCLEALDYGTRTWEDLPSSLQVRQQAALVLGKLEPVCYDERVYEKLLQVMENDRYVDVRGAAYGALVRLARIRDGLADAAA